MSKEDPPHESSAAIPWSYCKCISSLLGVRQRTTGVKILHSRYCIFHCLVAGSTGLSHIAFVVTLLDVVGTEQKLDSGKNDCVRIKREHLCACALYVWLYGWIVDVPVQTVYVCALYACVYGRGVDAPVQTFFIWRFYGTKRKYCVSFCGSSLTRGRLWKWLALSAVELGYYFGFTITT